MSGKLKLTPWAAQALTAEDRAALIARIPDGCRLQVGGGKPGHWSAYLIGPGAAGCIASTNYAATWQTAADTVFAAGDPDVLFAGTVGDFLDEMGA